MGVGQLNQPCDLLVQPSPNFNKGRDKVETATTQSQSDLVQPVQPVQPFSADLPSDDVVSPNFPHTTKATDQNFPDQEEEAKPDPCDQEIRAGDWVELVHIDGHEGDRYRVKNCGPTHVEIEGCSDRRAVPVWAVKRVQIGEKRNK
jgi:hypothetical protein